MRYMMTYDLMETLRNTNQWLGATARTMASYPAWAMMPNPAMQWMAAWGEVTERSFERMVVKPDWGIRTFTHEDGKDHLVEVKTIVERPFGNLIHFDVIGRKEQPRKILLVAPMSGHYATLPPLHGEIPNRELRSLRDGLEQCARHPRERGQVRCRGLHPLPDGVHARTGPRHQRRGRLPARAPDARGNRLSGRA